MFTSYIVLLLSLFQSQPAPANQPAALAVPAPLVEQPAKRAALEAARAIAPETAKAPDAPLPRAAVEPAPFQLGVMIPLQPLLEVAVAPSATDVVKKVQSFYNTTKSFEATFSQTVTNQTFNKLKPKVSKGKVYILKPGKMRWDYKNKSYKVKGDPKVSKSFLSDGKHLWAVMHKNKQYYKEDLQGSTLPVALSFLMGTGDLLKDFDVTLDTAGKYGSKSDLLLLLTPKVPSARYKKLWLVVDKTNFSVKQSVVLNTKGDTNAIRFNSVVTNNSAIKPGLFVFNARANKDFRLIKAP